MKRDVVEEAMIEDALKQPMKSIPPAMNSERRASLTRAKQMQLRAAASLSLSTARYRRYLDSVKK